MDLLEAAFKSPDVNEDGNVDLVRFLCDATLRGADFIQKHLITLVHNTPTILEGCWLDSYRRTTPIIRTAIAKAQSIYEELKPSLSKPWKISYSKTSEKVKKVKGTCNPTGNEELSREVSTESSKALSLPRHITNPSVQYRSLPRSLEELTDFATGAQVPQADLLYNPDELERGAVGDGTLVSTRVQELYEDEESMETPCHIDDWADTYRLASVAATFEGCGTRLAKFKKRSALETKMLTDAHDRDMLEERRHDLEKATHAEKCRQSAHAEACRKYWSEAPSVSREALSVTIVDAVVTEDSTF